MSDQPAHPQPTDPRVWNPAAAPRQPLPAEHAWVDGYEPGNPWEARRCMRSAQGTVAYPLTPHTMPELLEALVRVAEEQQGLPVTDPRGEDVPDQPHPDAEEQQGAAARRRTGPAARLTGWAVVHDLWEREDPTARLVMGAVVVALLVVGIFLA
ncbi:hypothetical protein ABZS86_02560 [Streptomyces sp. NPDC005355]|uniref:hypothetical protein n=1 Tax=Streptomyces sp. NPDC005355 TaxID=3157038 RepID=UPI0033A6AEF5